MPQVTLPTFAPCQFGKDYTHSEEYKAMSDFFLEQATHAHLLLLHEKLDAVPVETSWNGRGYPQETISVHFWIWPKGTARTTIQMFLVEIAFLLTMKKGREE